MQVEEHHAGIVPKPVPSPFVQGANNNYLCISTQPGIAGVVGSSSTVYTFGSFTYPGSSEGSYELTFVALDASTGRQWSADPEFDTGS